MPRWKLSLGLVTVAAGVGLASLAIAGIVPEERGPEVRLTAHGGDESPEPTETPEVEDETEEAPEPTETPDATGSPALAVEDEPDETPEPTETPEVDEDEVEDDRASGEIVSFDEGSGTLTVAAGRGTVSGTVADATEIEWESSGSGPGECEGDEDASTADLQAGTFVSEMEFRDGSDVLEEVELVCPGERRPDRNEDDSGPGDAEDD